MQRLQHPDVDFYVHLDRKVSLAGFAFLKEKVEFSFVEDRISCNWGGNSLSIAILNSLREILASHKRYDYINVVSGQDYPLISAPRFLNYLEENKGTNFISYDSPGSEWWKMARNRYEKYHFTDLRFKGKYMLERLVNRLMPRRRFPFFETLYGGSDSTWWTITADCASHVVTTISNSKKLRNALKYSWCTDEFIVATIIMNSRFRETVLNNNLRYIDWSEGNPRPKTLTTRDFHVLQDSKMMFARKFDVLVDEAILDLIDEQLLTKQQVQTALKKP